jgi:asparagine synthase (glutamine-hydrolysing)
MCGIFGVVGRDLADSAIENVFDVLHHRGPDGRGLFFDSSAKVTIAHTRLAVIDLVTGAQPLENEDETIILAANGEIYEFERIRGELEARGCRFRTGSDSEVIIHLYREFGLGCFDQLRGEFAFLLYDRAKRLFIAARDRFGIKPLYFSRVKDGFVFGSEMKALFASGVVDAKLNVAGFDPLTSQDPANPQFPFAGVEHVPPASYLTIDLETHEWTVRQYWSSELPADVADPVVGPATDDGTAAIVLREIEVAVRLRLRADVPVGVYLSGGLDSAFIAALMKQNLPSRPHSFSIAFEGSDRNEQLFARRAAEFVGTEHHELCVTRQMLWNGLEQCLWSSELPFVSLAPVGKFLLSEEARKFVTVVLTGEGADEVFLGYRTFFAKAIRETRKSGSGDASGSTQSRRLKVHGPLAAIARHFSLLFFDKSQRSSIRKQRANAASRPNSAKPLINEVQEARIAAMPFDILCFLGDREEMAHSLEARLPFLDHKLFDVAKSIPVDFKMRDGVEKAILRDAAKGILPDDLRLRRKSGFMLTSEAVDLYGADSAAADKLSRYLSKPSFERAALFSYRAFTITRLLARIPPRTRGLRRLRRTANKGLMYMLQAHMLHDMFVANPRWKMPMPELERHGSELNARENLAA